MGVSSLSRKRDRSAQSHGPPALFRLRGRGQLLAIFEAPALLTRLDIARGGLLVPELVNWETYWAPLNQLGNREVSDALGALHAAWHEYILCRFDRSLQREYCFRYFSLLELLLSTRDGFRGPALWNEAIRRAMGFECFELRAARPHARVVAAGTTTLRNPCYLLAKLKWPDVPDDTRFLPIIAVGSDDRVGLLFSHYRQYWPSVTSPISILVYLPIPTRDRSVSLTLVDTLAKTLGSGRDPYARERAERLWKRILHPIIQASHPDPSGLMDLEIVDVGAGSGGLTSALSRKFVAWCRAAGSSPRLRLWFVDLCLANPARFFRAASLRSSIDSLTFLGDDYRTWLSRPEPLPRAAGLRIALVSKVFDVLSQVSICSLATSAIPSQIADAASLKERRHSPAHCLAADGPGPEALMASYSRIALEEGRAFAQASLSDFYRSLRLAATTETGNEAPADAVHLPLRAFDPECLLASDGASVLSRLLEHCDYLIVEDADLRPGDLVDHLNRFSLHGLAAHDLTKAQGLTGNHAYILWPRSGYEPRLGGERLW